MNIKEHWLILVIIILGSFLRTWQLNSLGILFSDAGRDLLVAQEAVETNQLPLLGIPSSVPRFHQGPLAIWLHMVLYSLFGTNTLAFSLTFAFIGILALILTYEFGVLAFNKPTALIATTLLAVSPLAVAHARVPYHITPLPLAMILFLFALRSLWKKEKYGVFWAILGWAFLMQFELAMFGLFLLVPYVLWRQKYVINQQHMLHASAALLLGFAPQLIHDFTRPIAENQLARFAAWVVYRIVSLTGIVGTHSLGINHLKSAVSAFGLYEQRIFSTDYGVLSALVLITLTITCGSIIKHRHKLPTGIEIVCVALLVLSLSYLAHGGPSEAYFPPYPVLLSLLLGYGLYTLFKTKLRVLSTLLLFYALFTVVSIFRHNFFVSNPQNFSYGPSISEQRMIMSTINRHSRGVFRLSSTDEGQRFPTYLDNYIWLGKERNYHQSESGSIFYIDMKHSSLGGYPGVSKIVFESRDVYFR